MKSIPSQNTDHTVGCKTICSTEPEVNFYGSHRRWMCSEDHTNNQTWREIVCGWWKIPNRRNTMQNRSSSKIVRGKQRNAHGGVLGLKCNHLVYGECPAGVKPDGVQKMKKNRTLYTSYKDGLVCKFRSTCSTDNAEESRTRQGIMHQCWWNSLYSVLYDWLKWNHRVEENWGHTLQNKDIINCGWSSKHRVPHKKHV